MERSTTADDHTGSDQDSEDTLACTMLMISFSYMLILVAMVSLAHYLSSHNLSFHAGRRMFIYLATLSEISTLYSQLTFTGLTCVVMNRFLNIIIYLKLAS